MTNSTTHGPQHVDAASSPSAAVAAAAAGLSRRYHEASALLNDAGKYDRALEMRVRALEHGIVAASDSSASAGEAGDDRYGCIRTAREEALERARSASEIVAQAAAATEAAVRPSAQVEDNGGARMIGITRHARPARIGPTTARANFGGEEEDYDITVESAVLYNLGVAFLDRRHRYCGSDSSNAIALFELTLEAIFVARRRVSRPFSSSRSASNDQAVQRFVRGLDLLEVASLSNLGFAYYWSERYPSACLAYESAVDSARRALNESVRSSDDIPDESAGAGLSVSSDFGSDIVARLAECVTNLARSYGMVGRGEDAITAIQEARRLAGAVSGVSSSSFLYNGRNDGREEKKQVMVGGTIIVTMDELAEDQVYVEAHIRQRCGQIGQAMRGYRSYLFRTSTRRNRLISTSTSTSTEGGGGAPPSSTSATAANINPIVAGDLAARTAAAMHGAASCLLRRSKLEDAKRVALMALTIQERAVAVGFGSSSHGCRGRARPSRDAADTLCLLGRIFRHREEYVDSQEMYVRSAEMRCAVLGHDHPDTLMARCSVAMVLREQNDLSASLEACRDLLGKERRRLLPPVLKREMKLLEAALLFELMGTDGDRGDLASGKGASGTKAKDGAARSEKSEDRAEMESGQHKAEDGRFEWRGRCPDAAAA